MQAVEFDPEVEDEAGSQVRRARKNRKRDAMENQDENSFDDAFEGAPKKRYVLPFCTPDLFLALKILFLRRRRQEDLKKKHNITSQKGRQKINEAIQTLKVLLLPDSKTAESNKVRFTHFSYFPHLSFLNLTQENIDLN